MTNGKFQKQFIENAFKDPWVYPKLEDFVSDKIYTFTINPKYSSDSYFEMFSHFYQHIKPILIGVQYELFPEISQKNCKWHWHGYFRIPKTKHVIPFYLNILKLKSVCTFEIDTIADPAYWYTYVTKNKHLVKYYIKQLNLPYKLTHEL